MLSMTVMPDWELCLHAFLFCTGQPEQCVFVCLGGFLHAFCAGLYIRLGSGVQLGDVCGDDCVIVDKHTSHTG